MKYNIAFLLLVLASATGCNFYEQNEYEAYYVVESYLVANDSLPHVRLSKTSEITQKYTFSAFAVSNAQVEIRLLNPDSSVAERYPYEEQSSGIYMPAAKSIIQDEHFYQLDITTLEGHHISAITYVPKDFATAKQLKESYTYQSDQQIEILTTPTAYITGRQAYFIFTVNAIDPDSANLTPFYHDLVFNKGDAIGSYYISSSGIINERNYQHNTDGNTQLRVPWLAVAFYGSNDVIVNAIDNNMYNFLRSQNVQTGGNDITPGEMQNIRYNVTGGIGIFGSMSSDTNRVFIKRPDS